MDVSTRRDFLASGLALGAAALPVRALAADGLTVVSTTGMIGDTARVIGGERVSARALMGPGVDPHSYRQTRSDIVAMARADLVLWHGLGLEAQMVEFFAKLGETRNVRAVADGLPRDVLLEHPTYAGKADPHVWMDPFIWAEVADAVAAALIDADPEGEAEYLARAGAFGTELAALGAYGEEIVASVPEESRVLVTAHDAFGYFGRRYGFEVLGIQGISTESEAGLNRISELVDVLVDRQIGAVFVETSVSDRNMRALVEGAAARGHEVAIGGSLFSDAMGAPGTYEGSYVGMIDHNVTTIAAALGGRVPDGGMQGRLSGEG
ncbi:metal ABC transporter solute-binding protein, Zn/Mn family [Algicella marina]|nr:zinc ABC transporter substrate-binding protein [Algicella marina]